MIQVVYRHVCTLCGYIREYRNKAEAEQGQRTHICGGSVSWTKERHEGASSSE